MAGTVETGPVYIFTEYEGVATRVEHLDSACSLEDSRLQGGGRAKKRCQSGEGVQADEASLTKPGGT